MSCCSGCLLLKCLAIFLVMPLSPFSGCAYRPRCIEAFLVSGKADKHGFSNSNKVVNAKVRMRARAHPLVLQPLAPHRTVRLCALCRRCCTTDLGITFEGDVVLLVTTKSRYNRRLYLAVAKCASSPTAFAWIGLACMSYRPRCHELHSLGRGMAQQFHVGRT